MSLPLQRELSAVPNQNLWHNNFVEKVDSPLISSKNNFILLSYLKVHSCVHKSLPMDYILQQMHSFPSFTPHSSKAYSDIISPSTPSSVPDNSPKS
jgi:hypothetical protein